MRDTPPLALYRLSADDFIRDYSTNNNLDIYVRAEDIKQMLMMAIRILHYHNIDIIEKFDLSVLYFQYMYTYSDGSTADSSLHRRLIANKIYMNSIIKDEKVLKNVPFTITVDKTSSSSDLGMLYHNIGYVSIQVYEEVRIRILKIQAIVDTMNNIKACHE